MPNIDQSERDRLSPVWDISQERVFTMTLLNQRIHFLLLFFSLVVGGALNAKQQLHMNIILGIGAVVSWLLIVPVLQTQERVDKIMQIICSDPTHPYSIVSSQLGGHVRITVVTSYIVATLCCVLLTVGAVLAPLGVITVAAR